MLDAERNISGLALELRILRMLALFGLLDAEPALLSPQRLSAKRRHRKTPFIDRFLWFDVTLEPIEGSRH